MTWIDGRRKQRPFRWRHGKTPKTTGCARVPKGRPLLRNCRVRTAERVHLLSTIFQCRLEADARIRFCQRAIVVEIESVLPPPTLRVCKPQIWRSQARQETD